MINTSFSSTLSKICWFGRGGEEKRKKQEYISERKIEKRREKQKRNEWKKGAEERNEETKYKE